MKLKNRLDWFEKLPLLGKGVVVTRAREQASTLVSKLEELGACCYEFPTIKIKPLDDYSHLRQAITDLDFYQWIIFTSVNGVKFFWQELRGMGYDARALGLTQVAAIGPATASALRERGIFADFIPDKYVAESVVDGLLKLGIKGKKVLIPRAKKAREVLPEALRTAGADVDVLPVYETVLAQSLDVDALLEQFQSGKIHYVTFTSSSTVDNFFSILDAEKLKPYVLSGNIKLACIGPITAKTLQKYGFDPHIQPEDFTIDGLVKAMV